MKKALSVLSSLFLILTLSAQSPEKMSYQAVIRDAGGNLITTHSVGMRISILHGTTPVYVETHATSTNTNGLVTVEVGNGNFVSGIPFSTIDWSGGSYSIKTETDPTGGIDYPTIVGISQLLSVPYALHSKTAETISGTITETDPTFVLWDKSTGISITASQVSDFQTSVESNPYVIANTAKNSYPTADAAKLAAITGINTGDQDISAMTHSNRSALDAISGVNTGDQDGSETVVQAGTNVTITGAGTIASPYVVNSAGEEFTHHIGELFEGGIVVAVWKESGVEHGLIASLTDVSANVHWSSIYSALIGTTAQSPIDGQANTNASIAQGDINGAAYRCNNYTSGGYSDWYLPASWELNKCYDAAFIVNNVLGATDGFQFSNYWTSTEHIGTSAWYKSFSEGQTFYSAKQGTCRVRAVRRF